MLKTVRLICIVIVAFQAFIFSTSVFAEPLSNAPPAGYIVYSQLVGRWLPGTDTSGGYQLFLLTTGHTNPAPLAVVSKDKRSKLGAAVWYPLFSPDGKQILFTANSARGNVDLDLLESPINRRQGLNLFTMTISSKNLKAVTTDGSGFDTYRWSPDGKWISAVQMGWPPCDQVYIWDLAKGKRHLLTKRPQDESITDAFWSTDGKDILFQLWPSTGKQDPNLYAVSSGGGKPRVLIKGIRNRSGYSFSPDKQRIAFIQDGVVYIAKTDGSKALPVIKLSKTVNWPRPQWSRDSKKLAAAEVISDSTGNKYETKLHIYDLTTQQDKIITTIKESVTDIKWSKNGQWAILKIIRTGQTEKPNAKTGWYMFRREGLLAVSIVDGHIVTLKEPNEETKGLDWFEAPN